MTQPPSAPALDEALARICRALGYEFQNAAYLRAALTHRSHVSEHGPIRGLAPAFGTDNERLEFLGDAVLGLVVSETLWTRAPGVREGELSRMRAAVVNEASLADVAARAGVGEGLRLGRGEDRTGGRARPSMLADALEAVFAAVYLDGGLAAVQGVITRALASRIDEVVLRGVQDDKSTLQELLQARHKITPRYEVVATYGPDHDREHEVELRAGNIVAARGRGRSKKEAEQAAARAALETLDAAASSAAAPPTDAAPAAGATEEPAAGASGAPPAAHERRDGDGDAEREREREGEGSR